MILIMSKGLPNFSSISIACKLHVRKVGPKYSYDHSKADELVELHQGFPTPEWYGREAS